MATGPSGRTIFFMPTTLPGTPAAPTVLTVPTATAGAGKFAQSTSYVERIVLMTSFLTTLHCEVNITNCHEDMAICYINFTIHLICYF